MTSQEWIREVNPHPPLLPEKYRNPGQNPRKTENPRKTLGKPQENPQENHPKNHFLLEAPPPVPGLCGSEAATVPDEKCRRDHVLEFLGWRGWWMVGDLGVL